jgi:DNA mismatch repair protein MSH6
MDAIDRRVKVFWPEENAFFTGIVSKYDRKTEKHTVTYDDGDVEEVTLAKERMEWLEPGGDSLHPGVGECHRPRQRRRVRPSQAPGKFILTLVYAIRLTS